MSSLWRQPLEEFRARLASASPAPGGGSAAMVSAALGVGLLIMAAEIARKKKDADPAIAASLPELAALLEALSYHADRDIAVYEAYVAAVKLPKITQTEMAERDSALKSRLAEATEAPIAAAEDALKALEIAEHLAPIVHAGIVSDIGAGAALLKGGIDAALFMLAANLRSTSDMNSKEGYRAKGADIARHAKDLASRIHSAVERRLADA